MTVFSGNAVLGGQSTLSATGRLRLIVTATLGGRGALSATARLRLVARAVLAGQGGLSPNIRPTRLVAEAVLAGESAFDIDENQTFAYSGVAQFAGGGSFCALAAIRHGARGPVSNTSQTGPGPTNNILIGPAN